MNEEHDHGSADVELADDEVSGKAGSGKKPSRSKGRKERSEDEVISWSSPSRQDRHTDGNLADALMYLGLCEDYDQAHDRAHRMPRADKIIILRRCAEKERMLSDP